MFPIRRITVAAAFLVFVAGVLVGPACVLAGTTSYRLRLVAPPGARLDPGSVGWWVEERAREIGEELGVSVRPVITAKMAVRLGEQRRIAMQGAALRFPGADLDDPLAELVLWTRFTLEGGVLPESLESDPRIDRIEEVAVAEICALAADDPFLRNQQPYLDLVGLPDAWAASADPPPVRIRVAVVDGGTDWLHPDLLGNVAINPLEIDGDGIDQDGNGFIDDVRGWNFANDSPDPAPLPDQEFNARHGTHVAGTIGAVLGNGIGVAGVAGNPELILINAAHPTIDGGIAWGYEGILYAVARGADIINCSWRTVRVVGGQIVDAPYSEFEAQVLRLARESGALVIAATGNDFADGLWTTPAGYPDVVAVGATNFTEAVPWPAGNTAEWIDVVAPGQRIMSTLPRSTSGALGPYGLLSGTSMAAAVTSGVAALVAGQHPDWTVDQLRSRLRWTATSHPDLGDLRLLRADLALAADTGPDVRLRVTGMTDADGDGLAEGGEIFDLRFGAEALFERQFAVRVEAWTDDPWLVPLIDQFQFPSVPVGSELDVLRGLKFWVSPSAPPGHLARLQLRATSDGIQGPVESGTVLLRPLAARASNPVLRVSAAANGVLGEATQLSAEAPSHPAMGRLSDRFGFLRRAALLIANGPASVSDAMLPRAPSAPLKDFAPGPGGLDFEVSPDGTRVIRLLYSDRNAPRSMGLNVLQRVILREGSGVEDFVVVEYEVTALDGPIDGLRWGLAMDWAVPAADPTDGDWFVAERLRVEPGSDGVRVEAAEGGTGLGVAGVRILGDPREIGIRSLAQWQSEEEEGWNVPGDYRATVPDSVIWNRMAPGFGDGLAITGDRVAVVSARLGRIEKGETARFAIAMAIADDPAELDEKLERARLGWEAAAAGLDPGAISTGLIRFSQNPFRSRTELSFVLAESGPVRVDVFDLRGRRVKTLIDETRRAGVHRIGWSGRDANGTEVASGVYLVRLKTAHQLQSKAVTRVR